MKFILPVILLVAAGAVFMLFTDDHYAAVQDLRAEQALYDQALDNSKELQAVRDELLAQYNSFSSSDLERLNKLLPSHVDNVRLVRDIDEIASIYDMTLRNVGLVVDDGNDARGLRTGNQDYGTVVLSFTVSAPYKTFVNFLEDLERSLRIVDIASVSFNSGPTDLYQYSVSLRTYWLKANE